MLSYNLIKDVSITWGDDFVKIAGPKGVLLKRKSDFCLAVKDSKLFVWSSEYPHKENAYLSWLHQLIIGVTKGYTKKLRLIGVGFRATVTDNTLKLKLGFSHIVDITIPQNLKITRIKNFILVEGVDAALVGNFADFIKKKRLPDLYKGKGIFYKNENIKLKIIKKN
jgi:large subunit ribosomal protein L6